MTDRTEENDVNEAFKNLLLAENFAEEKAYKEGYAVGKNQMFEGYHLGYHRASTLAAQLGYYFGILIHLKQSSTIPQIFEQSTKLIEDIQKFPVDNDDAVDIFDKFENIKSNFKKICSLAKRDSTYPESNKLEF